MYKADIATVLIPLFTALTVYLLLLIIRQFLSSQRRNIINRLNKLNIDRTIVDEEDILTKPFLQRVGEYISKWLINLIKEVTPDRLQEKIKEKLDGAGNPRSVKPAEFLGFQALFGLVVFLLCLIIFTASAYPIFKTILLALTMGALAIYIPWFTLSTMATKRQTEMRNTLPEIMDLLVISVEAGLTFELALAKVVQRFPGTIAQEFARVLREVQLGKVRKEALKDMAERSHVPELSSLINAVIQADQLGVSLAQILRIQADMIREKRQQMLEEQAMKAPIKMLFPLILFIFPCMFIILLGPALISIMRSLL
jgi:tight adherence protein C